MPELGFLEAPAWLTSLAVLALAGIRGALWIRQAKFNGGAAVTGPADGSASRTAERTLVLVERQQEDLEAALRVLGEQQALLHEDQAMRGREHEMTKAITEQLTHVAQSLNKSASVLTAINLNVEAARNEIVEHRARSATTMEKVEELHRELLPKRRRPR